MAAVPSAADAKEIPLSTVRRLTAERLAASAREAPHFYLTVVADAGQLLAFRAQTQRPPRRRRQDHSLTDLLTRACAVAVAAHPGSTSPGTRPGSSGAGHVVIVGIAVAVDDGLIVPVIRDADRKTRPRSPARLTISRPGARARKLSPDELSGGTFTISNLGMYGIRQFTAVINPPQAAILAVGEAIRQPVVRGDQVTVATTMTLTLSIDHRAVDGTAAARFPHRPQGTDRGTAVHRGLKHRTASNVPFRTNSTSRN